MEAIPLVVINLQKVIVGPLGRYNHIDLPDDILGHCFLPLCVIALMTTCRLLAMIRPHYSRLIFLSQPPLGLWLSQVLTPQLSVQLGPLPTCFVKSATEMPRCILSVCQKYNQIKFKFFLMVEVYQLTMITPVQV